MKSKAAQAMPDTVAPQLLVTPAPQRVTFIARHPGWLRLSASSTFGKQFPAQNEFHCPSFHPKVWSASFVQKTALQVSVLKVSFAPIGATHPALWAMQQPQSQSAVPFPP